MKYAIPYLVQTMTMTSRDPKVLWSERFYSHCMGSSHFEAGEFGQRLRELNSSANLGTVMVDDKIVRVVYNPDFFDLAGVDRVLNELYRGEHPTEEPARFNAASYELLRTERCTEPVNAWFDIEHGLFWTFEPIVIHEVLLNIRASVQQMDHVRQVKKLGPAMSLPPNDPHRRIRERMIAEGRLRPRSQ